MTITIPPQHQLPLHQTPSADTHTELAISMICTPWGWGGWTFRFTIIWQKDEDLHLLPDMIQVLLVELDWGMPARSLHDHLNVQGNKPPQERLQKSKKKICFHILTADFDPASRRRNAHQNKTSTVHAKNIKCIALTYRSGGPEARVLQRTKKSSSQDPRYREPEQSRTKGF